METWPGISILIPTYNRLPIVSDTVACLMNLLIYPGKITFWLGVDNDNESAAQVIKYIKQHCGVCVKALNGPRRTSKNRRGYLGDNLNMLLTASLEDDLLMQMDDDHRLLRSMDLREHVEKLVLDETAGWIRLMGVGFHNYCGCLDGRYWRVNWDSPELYIPSNRPHIKHRRFHAHYGAYPVQLKLGETEERFCHKCKDKAKAEGGPSVLVPLDVMTESSWEHVGITWQHTDADGD